MTIVTRRTLVIPYTESFESDFLMLNCCAKNRAQMNGPKTVASAKQLFQRVLHDPSLHAMAVLDNYNREYMGHVFVEVEDGHAELGYIFDKAYWGQGLASEALLAFFPKMCQRLGLEKVVATANLQHYASIAILHKLGFHLLGTNEDVFGPYYEFAWLKEETATSFDAVAHGMPAA
ncbi:GNAT family N-acetyltransferase [Vibrio fluvialis]|nr:GNAT family N-acetyltransferase [Vibrio fluvialis]